MDSGDIWSDVNEVVVPDAQSGYQMPANAEITASDTNVLLLWQVGEPGVRCNIYTKWSKDGGADWDTSVRMGDGFTSCPDMSRSILATENIL